MYCSQQIHIPPEFPGILKQFSKAAIKTQPYDLLRWSCAYFRAISKNLEPPVKERLEYPIVKNDLGLTPGCLKLFFNLMKKKVYTSWKEILYHWASVSYNEDNLVKLLLTGKFDNPDMINIIHFIALSAGYLSDSLFDTMILFCNIVTDEPDGGNAMVTLAQINTAYVYLANLDCSKQQLIKNMVFYIDGSDKQYSKEKIWGLTKLSKKPSEFNILKLMGCVKEIKTRENGDRFTVEIDIDQLSSGSMVQQGKGHFNETENMDEIENESFETNIQSKNEVQNKDSISNEENEIITSASKIVELIQVGESICSKCEFENQIKPDGGKYLSGAICKHLKNDLELLKDNLDDSLKVNSDLQSRINSLCRVYSNPHLNKLFDGDVDSYDWESISELETPNGNSDSTNILYLGSLESSLGSISKLHKTKEYIIEPIPGIGEVVNEEIQGKFLNYLNECAMRQQGMVMPRNLRHYMCPPLENIKFNEK